MELGDGDLSQFPSDPKLDHELQAFDGEDESETEPLKNIQGISSTQPDKGKRPKPKRTLRDIVEPLVEAQEDYLAAVGGEEPVPVDTRRRKRRMRTSPLLCPMATWIYSSCPRL